MEMEGNMEGLPLSGPGTPGLELQAHLGEGKWVFRLDIAVSVCGMPT